MQPDLFICYKVASKSDDKEQFNIRAIYTDELNALRYAVEHGMKVRQIDEGDIIDQLKGEAKPRQKASNNGRIGRGTEDERSVNAQPSTPQTNPNVQGGLTREQQLEQAENEGFNAPPQTGYPAPGDGPARFPDGQDLNSIHYGRGTR